MARAKGTVTNVRIPLNELVEMFKDAPNIKVTVSVGFLREAAGVLDVDVSKYLPEVGAESAPAESKSGNGANFDVE